MLKAIFSKCLIILLVASAFAMINPINCGTGWPKAPVTSDTGWPK